MRFVIAASWVPIDLARAHYVACDRMKLGDRATEELGSLMAASVSGTLLASLLRTVRSAGLDSLWTVLKQNDRLWDRMYQGGGVTVIKLGPKDLILENTVFHWSRVATSAPPTAPIGARSAPSSRRLPT
jgi:hypothetical protein